MKLGFKIQVRTTNVRQNIRNKKLKNEEGICTIKRDRTLKIEQIHPKSNNMYEIHFDMKNHNFLKITFNNKIEGSWPSSSIYPIQY